MYKRMTAEQVLEEIGVDFRGSDSTGGHCANFKMLDGGILEYDYIPGPEYEHDAIEYSVHQYDTVTGKERHRGITSGCFWTDWE